MKNYWPHVLSKSKFEGHIPALRSLPPFTEEGLKSAERGFVGAAGVPPVVPPHRNPPSDFASLFQNSFLTPIPTFVY